jgi:hypothetical protein
MSEQHYYADVNLPFHVWVRERAGARGYRWVLRNASEVKQGREGHAGAEGAGRLPGTPLQLG